MLDNPIQEDPISEADLEQLSRWLADNTGLDFPRRRYADLERRVRVAASELGYRDCRSYVQAVLSRDDRAREFAASVRHFTVGETYFFRERAAFDALAQVVLPAVIDQSRRLGRRRIRIWSAACSTGEEPYSIAILLDGLVNPEEKWHITLLASDIDARALKVARGGIYRHWSFRGMLDPWHQRYFEPTGDGRFQVGEKIRDRVSFVSMNLARDVYPSLTSETNALDVVLCRNALMYFRPDQARRVVGRLWRCLLPGGWLIVGAVEAAADLFAGFEPVRLEDITVYRKPVPGAPRTSKSRPRFEPAPSRRGPHFVRAAEPADQSGPRVPSDTRKTGFPRDTKLPREKGAGVRDEERLQKSTESTLEELYLKGRYPEAATAARALLETRENSVAMNLLARILANQGRLIEALEWARRAIEADEFNARHHYLQALIRQEVNQTEGAIASLQRALYLDPGFALAHVALGGIFRRRGAQAAARRAYMAALRLVNKCVPDEPLAEADGLTAGRLREILKVMLRD